MQKNQRNQQRGNIRLLAVSIAGIAVQVNPASIDKKSRQVLHGSYKGTQVNSPAICQLGDSAIFWPDADKSFAVAMPKADLGVLATKFLESEGHTVTLK